MVKRCCRIDCPDGNDYKIKLTNVNRIDNVQIKDKKTNIYNLFRIEILYMLHRDILTVS